MFRVIDGSTGHMPLVFGVETALWPTAVKKLKVVPGDPRSSRTVHVQVARGGGREEYAAPRIRHGWRPGEREGDEEQ